MWPKVLNATNHVDLIRITRLDQVKLDMRAKDCRSLLLSLIITRI